MELTNAPELISERLLRVRFQGGTEGRQFCNRGQLQNSLQKESRGFCDSFPSGRWVAEVVSSGTESKQRADWATCSLWAYREATCRCEAARDWRAQRVYLSKADGVKISCHKRKALQGQAPTGWGQTLTLTTKKNSLFFSEQQFLIQPSCNLNVFMVTWSHTEFQFQLSLVQVKKLLQILYW